MTDKYLEDKNESEIKSKTQLKREAEDLQALGSQLVKLKPTDLAKLSLDEQLQKAIKEAQKITSNGAIRRQMQYIGRLMRERDPEPIRQALFSLSRSKQVANKHFHEIEQWRERLIQEGDQALAELIKIHSTIDRQHLRQLIRKAQEEQQKNLAPHAIKNLFRYLQTIFS